MIIGHAEFHCCPVDGCNFTTPAADSSVFSGFAPNGLPILSLDRESFDKVEATLKAHAATHTLIDYLATIDRLHGELTALRRMATHAPEEDRDDHVSTRVVCKSGAEVSAEDRRWIAEDVWFERTGDAAEWG